MVVPVRNFKTFILQEYSKGRSKETGATVNEWIDVTTISISIVKSRQSLVIDKVRRIVETYKGLTKSNLLIADTTRLISIDKKECYLVKNVIPSLWNNIELEKLEVF
ncbi:hypothetical protein [Clostridium thermobutyricum]|uniref:hypothetical protein n=1 Tax=Clostridium thermobutyricum TaxID=29372 RepID=UPI00294319C5|nr:hypothetical protein [Clostridium thermobutyricum]